MLTEQQKAALTDYNQPTESVAVRNKRAQISPAILDTWDHGIVPFETSAALGKNIIEALCGLTCHTCPGTLK